MKPPSPEEMKAMAERMQGGGGPGGLPTCQRIFPPDFDKASEFAGTYGLKRQADFAGLGGFPGKKK